MTNQNPYQSPLETSDLSMQPFGVGRRASPLEMTWEIIRSHFALMAICYLVVWLPVNLLISYVEYHYIDPDDFRTSFRLQQAATNLFGIFADAAIIATVVSAYDRRPVEPGSILVTGLVSWAYMWTTRLCVGIITIIGLLCFVVPGIYFVVRSIYADVVAVSERSFGPTAIGRSFEVTKGRFGEHLLKTLVVWGTYVIGVVAMMMAIVPLVIFFEESDWYWIAEGIFSLVFGVSVIFVHVYLYCCYRQLSDQAIADGASR